ncbi:secretion protein E [Philodulcilactobacillus myokoensis]|uniref:Secretion protein E n=1 Tax=Philodulcilactobacillus myokoensis TaxID=2929573 RepID=A0A9W6ESF0_9LACO|nr:competence type IV pilus ATPase ComGA [Philodulcilactobacillus myokoensis]GLB46700.1 secretion protein E [Philodulcilactobacillus myokoensis]
MSINKWLTEIIRVSILKQYSDIYIIPQNKSYDIRMHSNFKTFHYRSITNEFASKIINYCKYKSGMVISEHRRPQLGSMTLIVNHQNLYLRFSTVSNFKNQESLVIRIMYDLKATNQHFVFRNQFKELEHLSKKRGLMLFAGPTGSGKTTSIYHLAQRNCQDKMVMTIEDPVEIRAEQFLQLQVNDDANMSYQELLKVGLRHRPDVFIIGEIRDEQTAKVAIEASLSGHLVMSTVHAKTPLGVINRLRQLGISEYHLKQSLNSIIYQRIIKIPNGLGALLSINECENLFLGNDNQSFYQDWRNHLNELVQNQIINIKQAEDYWYG